MDTIESPVLASFADSIAKVHEYFQLTTMGLRGFQALESCFAVEDNETIKESTRLSLGTSLLMMTGST